MKRIILIFVSALTALSLSAMIRPINLQDGGDVKQGTGNRNPIPSVTFDDETNVLELSSLFVIGQATMTIRDADGNVLTTSTFYFGSSQTFPLSNTLVADMYSIELFYDNRHLIGYFDFGEED